MNVVFVVTSVGDVCCLDVIYVVLIVVTYITVVCVFDGCSSVDIEPVLLLCGLVGREEVGASTPTQ